jgi:hypothetical protein
MLYLQICLSEFQRQAIINVLLHAACLHCEKTSPTAMVRVSVQIQDIPYFTQLISNCLCRYGALQIILDSTFDFNNNFNMLEVARLLRLFPMRFVLGAPTYSSLHYFNFSGLVDYLAGIRISAYMIYEVYRDGSSPLHVGGRSSEFRKRLTRISHARPHMQIILETPESGSSAAIALVSAFSPLNCDPLKRVELVGNCASIAPLGLWLL